MINIAQKFHNVMTNFVIEEGATMIFNNKCEVRYNHDKELISLMKDFTENPYF